MTFLDLVRACSDLIILVKLRGSGQTVAHKNMHINTYNTTQVVKPIREVTLCSDRNCNAYKGQAKCTGKIAGKITSKPTNIPIRRLRSKPKRPKRKVKFTRLEHQDFTSPKPNFKTGKSFETRHQRSVGTSAPCLPCAPIFPKTSALCPPAAPIFQK